MNWFAKVITLHLWWILGIFSLGTVLLSTNCICQSIQGIFISLFSASIFHFILVFIPNINKRRLIKKIIRSDFFRMCEYARLSRQCVDNVFSFENKTWSNENEYVEQFATIDLSEEAITIGKSSYTKLQQLEYYRSEIRNIAEHLMTYQEYLSFSQFKTLSSVLASLFIRGPIEPINWDLSEEERSRMNDNQKDIGRSIYQIYDIIKKQMSEN